ncbi:hypothetical protein J4209_04715 [Candidatus Woesearchaeota archaeon]|nr:hypothetical protein [Candidatus Woesearchaeota archaeon]
MNIIQNIKFGKLLQDFEKLKRSVSEWVIALDTKQYETEKRVAELESRINELEKLHNREIQ